MGEIGSFLYPPPFLRSLGPVGQFPWPIFLFGWTALLTAAAVAMLRRVPAAIGPCGHCSWSWPVPTSGPETSTCSSASAVLALTSPIAWAGLALTKVTPGVGALWHGFRGRWPELALALSITLVGAGLSFVAPRRWGDWLSIVLGESPPGPYQTSVPVPLVLRFPLAIAPCGRPAPTVHGWSRSRMAALPVIWFNGLSMLLGAAALIDHRTAPFHPRSQLRTEVSQRRTDP